MELLENNINIHICTNNVAEPHSHKYLELAYVLYGSAVHKFNDTNEEIILSLIITQYIAIKA